jgi:hypothetical protein
LFWREGSKRENREGLQKNAVSGGTVTRPIIPPPITSPK